MTFVKRRYRSFLKSGQLTERPVAQTYIIFFFYAMADELDEALVQDIESN